MIVVADTSPLNYLILIDQIDLLRQLYDEIVVPSAVLQELSHGSAPTVVRLWAADRPVWVRICDPQEEPDIGLASLDKGESEAIQIALELHADRVLIDELRGRAEAEQRGLSVMGTIGVLILAGKLRLIDPIAAYRRLVTETSFRASPALEEFFLAQVRSTSRTDG